VAQFNKKKNISIMLAAEPAPASTSQPKARDTWVAGDKPPVQCDEFSALAVVSALGGDKEFLLSCDGGRRLDCSSSCRCGCIHG